MQLRAFKCAFVMRLKISRAYFGLASYTGVQVMILVGALPLVTNVLKSPTLIVLRPSILATTSLNDRKTRNKTAIANVQLSVLKM